MLRENDIVSYPSTVYYSTIYDIRYIQNIYIIHTYYIYYLLYMYHHILYIFYENKKGACPFRTPGFFIHSVSAIRMAHLSKSIIITCT